MPSCFYPVQILGVAFNIKLFFQGSYNKDQNE